MNKNEWSLKACELDVKHSEQRIKHKKKIFELYSRLKPEIGEEMSAGRYYSLRANTWVLFAEEEYFDELMKLEKAKLYAEFSQAQADNPFDE